MSNSGVTIIIAGKDDTGTVFEAVESRMKGLQASAHETEGSFNKLGDVVKRTMEYMASYEAIRLAIDGIREAITGALEFGEQIERASKKTGLAVGTLSVLHYAAATTGGDFDGMTAAVAKMNRTIAQATEGNKTANAFIRSLGMNARDLADQGDGAEVAFKKFSQTLAATESPVRRVELATGLLGRAGAEQIPTLIELGTNFDKYKQAAKDAGTYLDEGMAEKLEAANRRLQAMKQEVLGATVGFTQGLMPALHQVADDFKLALGANISWQSTGQRAGLVAMGLAYAFAYVAKSVRQAADEYEVWEAHINGLGDKVDSKIGFTASQRKMAADHYQADIAEDQHARADYKDAQSGFDKIQSDFNHFAAHPDQPNTLSVPGTTPSSEGYGGIGDLTAEELAHKIADAKQKLADAQRKAAQQSAQSMADTEKSQEDLDLARLEDHHKRQLVSDQEYYAQKAAIQAAALAAEESANRSKQGALDREIGGNVIKFGKDKGNAPAQIEDAARITELQTEVNKLEDQRLQIVEKRKQIEMEAGTEAYEAAKKQTGEAEKLAAEVEAIRGGSTSARQAQADAEYKRNRQSLAVNGASPDELANLDYQHQAGDADLGLKSAEDAQRNSDTDISTQRSAVKYQESSGQISAIQARQELIALDQQEAAALQPVLAAYEKLAALNVDGAVEKVAELKEKIAELSNPVSEVAAEIRGQLDSAFEELFVNMDRGKKAWQQFKKSLQSDLMKDTYKQFVEPSLQAALGLIVPHAAGGAGAKSPTPSSAAGGILAKVIPGLPGVGSKATSMQPIVQIINQSSTPVQGTATSQSQSDSTNVTEMLVPHVTQIVLTDLEHGGPIGQAIAGAGMLTP